MLCSSSSSSSSTSYFPSSSTSSSSSSSAGTLASASSSGMTYAEQSSGVASSATASMPVHALPMAAAVASASFSSSLVGLHLAHPNSIAISLELDKCIRELATFHLDVPPKDYDVESLIGDELIKHIKTQITFDARRLLAIGRVAAHITCEGPTAIYLPISILIRSTTEIDKSLAVAAFSSQVTEGKEEYKKRLVISHAQAHVSDITQADFLEMTELDKRMEEIYKLGEEATGIKIPRAFSSAVRSRDEAHHDLLSVVKNAVNAYFVLSKLAANHPARDAAEANINDVLADSFERLASSLMLIASISRDVNFSPTENQMVFDFIAKFTQFKTGFDKARQEMMQPIRTGLKAGEVGGIPSDIYKLIGQYAVSDLMILMHMQSVPGMHSHPNWRVLDQRQKTEKNTQGKKCIVC